MFKRLAVAFLLAFMSLSANASLFEIEILSEGAHIWGSAGVESPGDDYDNYHVISSNPARYETKFSGVINIRGEDYSIIPVAIWLFGAVLIYCFFRYSQAGTAGSDPNPFILFQASISGEPYDTLSSSEYSY